MPTKARGYWFCEHCPASFDTVEEAEEHERLDCLRNPHSIAFSSPFAGDPSYRRAASAAAGPPPQPPGEMPPQQHYLYYDVGNPPHPSMIGPPPPLQPVPPLPPHPTSHHPRSSPRAMRRYLLLETGRGSLSRDAAARLVTGDLVACRHLELIETSTASSPAVAASATSGSSPSSASSSPPGSPGPQHQVGLRCKMCGDSTRINELSLPRAIRFLADAIRRLSDQHLTSCPNLPMEAREVLAEASQRRKEQQQQEQYQQQPQQSATASGGHGSGGDEPSSIWQTYERERQLLVDFCTCRCRELGIINKLPENSGIVFRDSLPSSSLDDPFGATLMSSSSSRFEGRGPAQGRLPYAGPGSPPANTARIPSPRVGTAMGSGGNTGAPSEHHHPPPRYQRYSPLSMEHGGYYPPHGPPSSPYEPPPLTSFPYFRFVDGSWYCKFCNHLPPDFRSAGDRWTSPAGYPPPAKFIDHHLQGCRSYHQSLQHQHQHHPESPTYRQHGSPEGYAESPPHAMYAQQPRSPYPPPSYPPSHHLPAQHLMTYPPPPSPNWDPSLRTRDARPRSSASPRSDGALSPRLALGTESIPAVTARRSPTALDPMAEATAQQALEYLAKTESSKTEARSASSRGRSEPELVEADDKLLLTDFLFYLMKQLQIVRFSEADRKTRGGKRENIQIGFGGLECIHCRDTPKARKFFWSGVDRLANSFAEIPGHVFKCLTCPEEVKEALHNLKKVHSEQMARLPRGSQKVFFRRVWKRIHDSDPATDSPEQLPPGLKAPPGEQPLGSSASPGRHGGSPGSKEQSPEGTSGSEESIFAIDRPTKDAARALADFALHSLPPSPSSRVLLGITEDRDFLSDSDCFLRRQLEVFCATADDVRTAHEDGKYPVKEGQVGIRCVHCALTRQGRGARGNAVAYPYSIACIFESVREFQRLHLDYCENVPATTRSKISTMKESTTITSIQRRYYTLAAKGLGLYDSEDGIRAGSESVPVVSLAVFSFSQEGSPETSSPKELDSGRRHLARHFESPSQKRRREEDPGDSPSRKHTPSAGRGGGGAEQGRPYH